MAEIETFHEIDEIINPPDIPTDGSVLFSTGSMLSTGQAQPATLFKPQSDIKPIFIPVYGYSVARRMWRVWIVSTLLCVYICHYNQCTTVLLQI